MCGALAAEEERKAEAMMFNVTYTSDPWKPSGVRSEPIMVELVTLEEFIAWCRKQELERNAVKRDWPDYKDGAKRRGGSVGLFYGIIVLPGESDGALKLEIYDNYRE